MKKRGVHLAAAIILGGVFLALTSCFYMPGVSGGKARAGLVLPRFLIANPVSLALIVGGPGMEPIYASYTTIPASITIDVPSGLARTFTVLLNGPSATLQGVATVDLQPGETKEITVNPIVAGTQIVIPDWGNQQVAQISDMTGAGWVPPLSDVTTGLNPYDIDFDNQGRMYIADTNRGVLRVDDINDSKFVSLAGVVSTNVYSVAMDRPRGLLYYVGLVSTDEAYEVRRVNVNTGTDERVQVESIFVGPDELLSVSSTTAIAVDSDGLLYVSIVSPSAQILKINPDPATGPTVVRGSVYPFTDPWDVMVKGSDVYVSDRFNPGGKIVRLDTDLVFVDSLSGFGGDSFLGPERFVATLNKPITVIDEDYSSGNGRLVSFKDMSGSGWITYGQSGGPNTEGEFSFYSFGT